LVYHVDMLKRVNYCLGEIISLLVDIDMDQGS